MRDWLTCFHEAGHVLVALDRGFSFESASISEAGGHTKLCAPDLGSFADEISSPASRLCCSTSEDWHREVQRLLQADSILDRLVDVYLAGMSATLAFVDNFDRFNLEKYELKPLLEQLAGLVGLSSVVRLHRAMESIARMPVGTGGSTEFFRDPFGHPGAEADVRAITRLFSFSDLSGSQERGLWGGISHEMTRRVKSMENWFVEYGNTERLTTVVGFLVRHGHLLPSSKIPRLTS
jgi:hypothetical protein